MIMLEEVQDVEKIGKKCLEHKRSKEKALQKFNEICGLPNVVLNNTMHYMQQSKLMHFYRWMYIKLQYAKLHLRLQIQHAPNN